MNKFNVDLKDKVAIVTGGGGVLGRVFSKGLLDSGAKVAILDLREEVGIEAVNELKAQGYENVMSVACNVLDKESLENARALINETFGSCDILVNGAGGNHPKGTTSMEYFTKGDEQSKDDVISFFDLDKEGVEFVFSLNFMGTLLPSQVFSKDMLGKEDASIINISSMSSYTPLTKIPAYSGAKAAINNFTKWLAVHFANTNIRVNAIAPGFFETTQNKALLRNEDGSYSDRANKIIAGTPKARFGNPDELIGSILFLASKEAAGFITGIIIPIDGGYDAYSGV